MPSYDVEQRIKCQSADETAHKIKELEKELKRKERELADEKVKVKYKKCLHIFMHHKNEMRSDLRKSGTVFREKDVRSLKDQSVPILPVDSPPRQKREQKEPSNMAHRGNQTNLHRKP